MTVYFLYPPKQPFFKSLSALLYYFVLWKFSKDRFFAFPSYPNDRCRFSFESGCKGKSFSLFPPNILVNIFWKSFSCSPRLSPSLAWKSDAKVLLYPIRSKYITTFFMLKNIPNHTTALPSNRWTGDFFYYMKGRCPISYKKSLKRNIILFTYNLSSIQAMAWTSYSSGYTDLTTRRILH